MIGYFLLSAGTMSDPADNIRGISSRILGDVQRYDATHDPLLLDHLLFQVHLLRILLAAAVDNGVVQLLSQAGSALSRILETPGPALPNVSVPTANSSNRGRPRYVISEEQLLHLLTLKFDCPTIALMFGVSLRTVRRRMSEYGLSVSALYSGISDTDLDIAITSLKHQYPNAGYRMMNGLLLQQGIRVQQARIRESMHRVTRTGLLLDGNSASGDDNTMSLNLLPCGT